MPSILVTFGYSTENKLNVPTTDDILLRTPFVYDDTYEEIHVTKMWEGCYKLSGELDKKCARMTAEKIILPLLGHALAHRKCKVLNVAFTDVVS